MLDLVKLTITAGAGGHGRVSFWREKFVPKGGPDGGNGGWGGSVIVEAVKGITTLGEYMGKKTIIAQSGQMGGKRQKFGSRGDDLTIKVPVGTTIWMLAENQIAKLHSQRPDQLQKLQQYHVVKEGEPVPAPDPSPWYDHNGQLVEDLSSLQKNDLKNVALKDLPKRELVTLSEPGQQFLLVKGGRGGRGNEGFKSSVMTTPKQAEYGEEAESRVVIFELKLLADIGLVGLPNAGKSTMLSVLTQARPKIAAYPFTTLEPHLGVMKLGGGTDASELVIADIPGLIEGASQGKGLGLEFLRHIENCQALVRVLYVPSEVMHDPEAAALAVWDQYQTLERELVEYKANLESKSQLLILNKIDLYKKEVIDSVRELFKQKSRDLLLLSAATRAGLEDVRIAFQVLTEHSRNKV